MVLGPAPGEDRGMSKEYFGRSSSRIAATSARASFGFSDGMTGVDAAAGFAVSNEAETGSEATSIFSSFSTWMLNLSLEGAFGAEDLAGGKVARGKPGNAGVEDGDVARFFSAFSSPGSTTSEGRV
ncbi:hypothetical protein NUW54_g14534 [Trametes sanguinea]|uniref:Uncharacterized protein n=1 Tax=Trametes sanguinea TaxID=158606 RepID=A0ACC1MDK1_9APHY|nr:hypothetical protein NUW54_g14534 [Trametes sanguinea]